MPSLVRFEQESALTLEHSIALDYGRPSDNRLVTVVFLFLLHRALDRCSLLRTTSILV